jgi:hypothetical protein
MTLLKQGVYWASNMVPVKCPTICGETILRFRNSYFAALSSPLGNFILTHDISELLTMASLLTLPAEVRDLIYREALPRRVITVGCVYTRHTVKLMGRLLPPALFQVCREMRAQALTTYGRCEITTSRYARHCRDYEDAEDSNDRHLNKKTYVYVSYKYDTFYIPYNLKDILSILDLEVARIESLAVMLDWDMPQEWYIDLLQICKRLNLKRLQFVKARGVPGGLNRSAILHESKICPENSVIAMRIYEKFNGLLSYQVIEFPGEPESKLCKEDKVTIEGRPPFLWSHVNIEWDSSSLVRRWIVLTRFADNDLKDGL